MRDGEDKGNFGLAAKTLNSNSYLALSSKLFFSALDIDQNADLFWSIPLA